MSRFKTICKYRVYLIDAEGRLREPKNNFGDLIFKDRINKGTLLKEIRDKRNEWRDIMTSVYNAQAYEDLTIVELVCFEEGVST